MLFRSICIGFFILDMIDVNWQLGNIFYLLSWRLSSTWNLGTGRSLWKCILPETNWPYNTLPLHISNRIMVNCNISVYYRSRTGCMQKSVHYQSVLVWDWHTVQYQPCDNWFIRHTYWSESCRNRGNSMRKREIDEMEDPLILVPVLYVPIWSPGSQNPVIRMTSFDAVWGWVFDLALPGNDMSLECPLGFELNSQICVRSCILYR